MQGMGGTEKGKTEKVSGVSSPGRKLVTETPSPTPLAPALPWQLGGFGA